MVKRARMRFPLPLGVVARQEITALGLADRLREADIWRLWPEVVGPTVAARAIPLRIIKGTLTTKVRKIRPMMVNSTCMVCSFWA